VYLRPDSRPTTYSVTSRLPMIRLRPGLRSRQAAYHEIDQSLRAHGPYGWGARLVSHGCGSPPLGREGARGAGSGRRLEPCALLPLASRQP
jgi:hypothetical protein